MKYCVNLGCWNSVFAVPSSVVDEHIKLAGAASLKVLLYLLRHSGTEIDDGELSKLLSLSKEDVSDALGYWITCGVLSRKGETYTPAEVESTQKESEQETEKITESKMSPVPKKQKKERISYNFDECAEIMAKDSSIAEMLLAVEEILSKQLTHREVSLYVTLTHWYGFDTRLVPMLLHYCKTAGSLSSSYIEATGLGWIDEGVDTMEKAEAKVRGKADSRAAWRKVSSLLEIDRAKPSVKEEDYSNQWVNEWKMPGELINEAYERCINQKGKLSFSYMNGIMKKWYENGIMTTQQLREHEEKSADKKSSAGRFEPTYDKSEIEQLLWNEMLDELDE